MLLHVLTTVPIVLLCAILNIVWNTEGPQVFYVRPADTSSIVVFDKLYVETNIITSIPCTALSRSSLISWSTAVTQILRYRTEPRPRAVKFPCGVCSKGCFWWQRAICCDSCEIWYHAKCLNQRPSCYFYSLTYYHNTSKTN